MGSFVHDAECSVAGNAWLAGLRRLGLSSISVPWDTLFLSVLLYQAAENPSKDRVFPGSGEGEVGLARHFSGILLCWRAKIMPRDRLLA
jgi:hypothetical protein